MNFVLAAVVFALVFATIGRPVWPAAVGRVTDDSPAAAVGLRPGDVVTAVNGRRVAHWEDVERAVSASAGRPLELKVRRDGTEQTVAVTPKLVTTRDPIFREPKETWELGAGPLLIPQIGSVNGGSPAERAGLKAGDQVVAVAGQPVFTPEELMQAIQKRPGQTFDVVVKRDGQDKTVSVTATPLKEKGPNNQEVEVGRIGVAIVTHTVSYEPYPLPVAVWNGAVRTWDMTALTVKGLWKLASRQIDSSNIGGPIQIAAEAGRQAREGTASLALFTAIISVNLAVLNLLPVPMLDGGHLFFFVVEALLGRPLSLRKREWAQQVGFVLLMLLMVYALYNDLVRLDAFRFFK
jgi:regulator of sigma E protease